MEIVLIHSRQIEALAYCDGSLFTRTQAGVCFRYTGASRQLFDILVNSANFDHAFHSRVKSRLPHNRLGYDPFGGGRYGAH